jgi:TRAP-type mannitol/chloroaromatic compound transport system permease large subunit
MTQDARGVMDIVHSLMGIVFCEVLLFVMKGVAPDLSIKEIVYAAAPFILIEIVAMAIIIVWPQLVLWLPGFVS